MSTYTDEEIEILAKAVRIAHGVFADIHDPLARKHKQRLFMIVHALNAKAPIRAALMTACQHEYIEELLDKLNEAHAFDDAANNSDGAVVAKLEAMINRDIGFEIPIKMLSGSHKACRRVCRILIDGSAVGTGFLVGPQAILTACHVVDSLFTSNGEELPGSQDRLSFEFEHQQPERLRAAQNWLLAWSKPHEMERNADPFDPSTASDSNFDTCLDFALVRPERTAGRERGWYTLDEKLGPCVSGDGNRAVTLFQHPAGASMRVARGQAVRLWPSSHRTRVHHSANSLGASSGGLLLNSAYEMIGLHNAALEPAPRAANDDAAKSESEKLNVAVPTSVIAREQKVRDQVNTIEGLDPVLRIPGTCWPVIGRDHFQQMVLQALAGNKRILIARGNTGTGKSFSAEILKAMLSTHNHKYVSLQAADLSAIPEKLAATLLQPLLVEDAAGKLPSAKDAQTASDAWIRDVLYPEMMEQLRRAASDTMLWLIIDNIDINPLAQSGSTHLLDRIFSEIERYDFLRVVLLAPRRTPNSPPVVIEIDDCVHPTASDIKQYVQRRLQQVEREADPAPYVSGILKMANLFGGVTAENVARAVNDWLEPEILP